MDIGKGSREVPLEIYDLRKSTMPGESRESELKSTIAEKIEQLEQLLKPTGPLKNEIGPTSSSVWGAMMDHEPFVNHTISSEFKIKNGSLNMVGCLQSTNTPPLYAELLQSIDTETLFQELSKRGGHPAALARAALLLIKKSQDYNSEQSSKKPEEIDRRNYFPLGEASYAQMIHTKSSRFVALTKKIMDKKEPNFEGLVDTALDLINYAAFYVADASIKDTAND
jgi:hypothetical protein